MNDEANTPETETPEKVERIKQNGVTRPAEGTKTGQVWDTADSMSAELGRPVLSAELVERLGDEFNKATVSTQYAMWCTFHGVTAEQRRSIRDEGKAEERAAKEAAKAEAKAAKAAEREAAKQAKAEAKAAEKAEKKAAKAPAKESENA